MAYLASLLGFKRFVAWLLLLAGLGVGLCFVPLFNLLGYEFSLALALAASLAALHLGSAQVAEARRRDEGMVLSLGHPVPALALLLGRVAATNLLLLLLPLAASVLNALRVKNCDPLEGLAFFALMPGISVVIASVVGALWALALPRPALATAASVLTMAASLAWGVHRFHAAPPVFAYDPFAGFFPGTLYDEAIAVSGTFLLYRLHNLLWLGAAVAGAALVFDPVGLRLGRVARITGPGGGRPLVVAAAAGLLCLAGGGTLFAMRAGVGFAPDATHIAGELGGARRTEHFTIHYPVELEQSRVELLARDHEHRYRQLRRFFGAAPPRITSYIFRSAAEKQRLMGAGRTFIAKPWRREVYLQDLGFPHPVLKHELAHVFGARYGDRLWGVSLSWRSWPLPHPRFNVGLIEGLAVAADWRPYGELTAHQMSAALVRIGLAPPVKELFGAGFLVHAASRAYTMAGSFCRYLVGQHGVQPLLQAYRSGGDFQGAFGAPLERLIGAWSRFLAGVELPDHAIKLARERFRRPSILRRVCGREVASLKAEASRLAAREEHLEALELLDRVCRFDPGDPGHHLARVRALVAARELAAAGRRARQLLAHPALSKPMERTVQELLGDLAWWRGDPPRAASWYRLAAQRPAGPGARRVLALKRWGLAQPPPVRKVVGRYIAPPPHLPREAGLDVHLAHRLDHWLAQMVRGHRRSGAATTPRPPPPAPLGLGLYLVGKQLAARRHCPQAIPPLQRALASGLLDRDFQVEALLTLGRCQLEAGQATVAAETFKALKALPLPAGTALAAADWAERCHLAPE